MGRTGEMRLERVVDGDPRTTLDPVTWTRASRRWASVTPVALDENPGDLASRDPRVAAQAAEKAAGGAVQSAGDNAHAVQPLDFVSMLFAFMLATFIGIGVIRRVSRLLHTPLMSLTNAVSAISVVGAILITGAGDASTLSKVLGAVAVTFATINVVAGFLITDRMLKMFKKEGKK